ncbi:unnamed protein product [Vitrella brassicaformis CCMP3155]|uniref:Nucleoporin Nup133/Nup155-like N-terminal domain-containing protein n=1 Tax=Vitrella brassicaformis (strain CCMP3155) TaxID=1169540 RepID=A0A0G4FB39_VITBC|nr:unnamed protein product [Vitrella brassicaformis CCMP3155]|eukprot:CEM10114.1 unnamed protein product [Vitrella brassicaformis CCMP3155]
MSAGEVPHRDSCLSACRVIEDCHRQDEAGVFIDADLGRSVWQEYQEQASIFDVRKTGVAVPQEFIVNRDDDDRRGAGRKGCYGIFPQIQNCFRGVDNGMRFWNYTGLTNQREVVQCYGLSESIADGPVLAADLVRPKASFQRQWQGEDWILVAATAHWLTFHHLRVIMVYPGESVTRSSVGYVPPKVVGRLDIRELEQYRTHTDKEETYTVVKAHQASGRIFVGGSRGHVYECDYERQKLIPLELSVLDYTPGAAARKTFVQLGKLANVFYQEVRQMAVDEARGLLYVLTADSWIRVFHIPPHAPSTIAYERDIGIPYVEPPRAQGTVGKPPATVLSVTVSPHSVDDRVRTLRTHRDLAALNRQDGQTTHSRRSVLPIVHVEPLSPTEGQKLLFFAVTHDGHRLFFMGRFGSSPFTPIQIGKPNPPTPAIRYEGPVSVELSKIHLPPRDSSIKVKDVFYAKGASLIVSECPPSASIAAAAAAAQLSPQQPLAPPPSLFGQQGPSPFAQQPPHRTAMPQFQGRAGDQQRQPQQQQQQRPPPSPPLSPSGGSDRDRQATRTAPQSGRFGSLLGRFGVGERRGDAADRHLMFGRKNNGLVGIAVDMRHVAQKRSAGLVTGRVSDSDHLQETSDLMDATQKSIAPLDAGWEVLAGSVVVPATECISYELPHIASLYSWAPMYLDPYNTTRRLEFHPRPPGSVQQQPRSGTPFAASMTRVPGPPMALPDLTTQQFLPGMSFVIVSNSEVLHVTKTRPIDQLAHLMVNVSLQPPAAAMVPGYVYGPPMQQDFQQFYNTYSPEQTCAMLWQLLCEWHRSAADMGLLRTPPRSPHAASVGQGLHYVSPLTCVSVPGVRGLGGGADQRVLEVLRRNLMTVLLSPVYRMFHQFTVHHSFSTDRGRDDKSPSGVLNMGQGTYSARLKGLYIYASRLLRAIWDAPLFQVAKEGAMGIAVQPTDRPEPGDDSPTQKKDTEWERFWGATFKRRRRTVGWLGGVGYYGEHDDLVEGRFLPSLTPTFTPRQRQHLQAQLTNLANVIRENRQGLEATPPPNGSVLPYGMPPPQHQANPFVTSFYTSTATGGTHQSGRTHRHHHLPRDRERERVSGGTTTAPVQPPHEFELLEGLLATLDSAIGVLNFCDIFDAPQQDRALTPATFNRLADTTFKDMIMPSVRPPPPAPQAAPTQAPYPYPAGGQTGGGPDRKRQATTDTEGRRADGRRGGVDGSRAREGGAGPLGGVVGEGVADLLQQLVLERVVDQNELRNRCPTLYTQLDADEQEIYLCLAAAKEHFARWEREGRPSGDTSKMGSLQQWAGEVNQAERVIKKHLPNPEFDIKTLLRKAEAAKAVRLFITMACERAKALDQHGVTARPSPPSAPTEPRVEQIYRAKEDCYSAILSLLEERVLVPGDRCIYYPDELMIDFGAKAKRKPVRMTAPVADQPAAAAAAAAADTGGWGAWFRGTAAGGGKRKHEATGVSVSEERVACVDRCRHMVQYCLRESADSQLHVMLFKWIIRQQQHGLHLHELDSPYLAQWLLGLMEQRTQTHRERQQGRPPAAAPSGGDTAGAAEGEAVLKSIPPDELAKYYSRTGLFAEACACYMNLAISPWPTRDIEPSFLAAETGDSWPPQHVNPSDWNVPAPHIDSTTTVDQLLANIDAAHFPSLADRGKFAVEASSYWERAREQGQAGRGGVSVVAGGGGGVGGGGLTGQVPRVGSSKLLNRWERDNCQMAYKTVMLQSTMLAEMKENLRELLDDAKTHLNSDGTRASSSHRTDIHRTLLGAHGVQQSLRNAAHLQLLAWNLGLYWSLLQMLRIEQWPDDGQERVVFLVRHLMDQAIRRALKSGNENVVTELVERLCSSFSPTADSATASQRVWQAALPIVVLKLTDYAYSARTSVGGPYWWWWPVRVLWGPQANQSVNELCAEGLPTFRFPHLTVCHALRNDMVRGEIRKLTNPDGRTAYDYPALLRFHVLKHLLDIITKALERSRVLAVHHRPGDTQRFVNDINAAHTEIKDLCDSRPNLQNIAHSIIDHQALPTLLRQVGELAREANRGRINQPSSHYYQPHIPPRVSVPPPSSGVSSSPRSHLPVGAGLGMAAPSYAQQRDTSVSRAPFGRQPQAPGPSPPGAAAAAAAAAAGGGGLGMGRDSYDRSEPPTLRPPVPASGYGGPGRASMRPEESVSWRVGHAYR